VVEKKDWAGNLISLAAYGDNETEAEDIQTYTYTYDHSNRVTKLDRYVKDSGFRTLIADRIPVTSWESSGDQIFTFEYEYNYAGMVTGMTCPEGSEHLFDYDAALGRLESISDQATGSFVTGCSYNKSGVVTRMDYDNLTYQTYGSLTTGNV
jgi:hypothetical protein